MLPGMALAATAEDETSEDLVARADDDLCARRGAARS